MASAGTVTLELDANSVKLIRELQKAQKQTKKSAGSMAKDAKAAFSSMRENAAQAAKYVTAAAAAMGTLAAATIRTQGQVIDQLAKTSDKLGVNIEELQALRYAAELTGVSQQTLDMALQRMTRRLAEAAQGTGEAKDALKELGLDAQALANMSPDEQFRAIADAMEGVTNQGDRVRLAMRLFDSEGVALVNTLAGGSKQLDEFSQQLDSMGGKLSRVDAAKVEQMNDAFRMAQVRARSFAQQFVVGVSSGISAILTMYSETESGLDDTAGKVESMFDEMILGSLDIMATIGPVFDKIKSGFTSIWDGFRSLPGWVQELGLFGAVILGKKGAAGVAAIAYVADLNNQAKKAIDDVLGSIGEEATAPSASTLPELVFGKDNPSDWDLWAEQQKQRYLKARAEVNETAQNAAPAKVALPAVQEIPTGQGGTADLTDEERKLNSIISSTRTQVEMLKEQIALVKSAIESGITAPFEALGTTGEEVLKRLENRLGEMSATGKEKFIDLAEMGKQAARGIHSAFVDFLMNPFEEGLKGMLKAFLNMLQRMIAEVVAAQILRQLFGGLAGSANGFLSSIGEAFGGVPMGGTRDVGGRGEPGKAYVINPKAGPEMFVPSTAGEFIPNIDEKMGGGTNLSLTIDARDAGAEARIKDMIVREMVPQIISAAKSDTLNTLRRPRFA